MHTNDQPSGMENMNVAGNASPMNRNIPPQPSTQGARVLTDEMLLEAGTLVRRFRMEIAASKSTCHAFISSGSDQPYFRARYRATGFQGGT